MEVLSMQKVAYKEGRPPHIQSGVGFVEGAKHNARVNLKGNEFIKFVKEGGNYKKQVKTKNTNISSYANTSTYVSSTLTMSYNDFDASYVFMRNKYDKIISKYVGPHNKRSKTCVWVPKVLVNNVRVPKQVCVPKTKV